jgi:hypothetical protein
MWTPILIWLAKVLIQHFLGTQLELKRKLEEVIKRNEEHELALSQQREKSRVLEDQIRVRQMLVLEKSAELLSIQTQINGLEKERQEKLAEARNALDNMPDSAVLREQL